MDPTPTTVVGQKRKLEIPSDADRIQTILDEFDIESNKTNHY